VTPYRDSVPAKVPLSHEVPSEEVRMVPAVPTVTKVLFPYVNPNRVFVVPEVLEVQVVPLSEEVRRVPFVPNTAKVLFP